ncbi:glycerophosphodiester phosphodiesterase [Erythrobacter sp. 3-20A1M]|uniref:glycerophosphodiester phosphodiesterase n=1 Tax=Erythrobacter sp. 3-20A1M TaxID=2653850 RepID=UPI001BFCACCD|nr:glycerophosphodiester phosphodiesterase [Erythrobacter sp. 3-20A1M]
MLKWLAALGLLATAHVAQAQAQDRAPIVIAHRGASGERPEHTLASYERAIDQGADYIEPDLVPTKDGVLVARHENEISGTTDIADHPEFADRRRAKTVDGELVNGWFVEDFTLAELQTLHARERLPGLRPANARFDGLYPIPTFAQIVKLVRAKEAETGRKIGLYPELKHPQFLLQDAGIDTVDLLLLALKKEGIEPADPIFIQCFEVEPLRRLAQRSDYRLVQLASADGGPADMPGTTYAEMLTPAGLADIAKYADGIGAEIRVLLTDDGSPTPVVAAAHAAGLKVHAWTLRPENAFLPPALQQPGGEAAPGNMAALQKLLIAAGVDGIFTDVPGQAIAARAAK